MSLSTDLRIGWREWRARPWVSVVAIGTLALGVAGATTMFTMLSAVGGIMVPPGVDAARVGRIVWLSSAESGARAPLGAEEFAQLAAAGPAFETLSASADERMVMGGIGGPGVSVKRISRGFLRTFDFEPSAGRAFADDDWRQGAARVALARESFVRRVPEAGLGRVLRLGSDDYAVVGILPDRCWFPMAGEPDLWLPLETTGGGVPAARSVVVTGRLRSPSDLALVQSQVEAVGHRLAQGVSVAPARRLRLVTLQEDVQKRMGFGLVGLLGPALVVLLIACGNVANLLLARATGREREMAVRAALGAGRLRLIRERLTEAVWLGAAGGVAGIGLAVAGVRLLRAWIGSFESSAAAADHIRLDGWALLFAVAITCLIPVVSGLVPAWTASKPTSLRPCTSRRGGAGRVAGLYGGRDLMVIVEVALAVVLVVMAGMFTRFFAEIARVDWGFDPTKVLRVELSVDHGPEHQESDARLLAEMVEAVARVPGVRVAAAGGGSSLPRFSDARQVEFEGCASATGNRAGRTMSVGPGYFAALGLPVRRGRAFTTEDTAASLPVGVISASHAATCWPGQDPVGHRFRLSRNANTSWITVVGVAPDTMVSRVFPEALQPVYLPYVQQGSVPRTLLVRSDGDVTALAGAIRSAIRMVDPTQPLDNVDRFDADFRRQVGEAPAILGLMGGFAGFALLLGALGVFSVMSYLVAERTREFGIRIAIGASRRDILGLVLRHAFVIVGIGAAVSIAGTLAVTRATFREMADLAATSVGLWAAVSGLLVVVALGATLIPARRATRVEPVLALRAE